MKKVVIFVLLLFTFITSINASNYKCNINGDNQMNPYDESRSIYFYLVNEKIDIEGINELSTFKMHVSYDNDLYSAYKCNLLDKSQTDCDINKNDNSINYTYKYSSKYNLNTNFYTVTFVSTIKTPSSGNSTIKVYFDSAKDKNGNEVSIEECTTTITFKDLDGYIVPSEVKTNEEVSESSILIKTLEIKDYNIEFDPNTFEYSLKVQNDVNKLDINVELMDTNGSYIVRGASDLNSFGNKVVILVKSSNNEEKEYIINVLKDKKEVETTDVEEEVNKLLNKKIIKKYLPYILGGFVLIIVIILIVKKLLSKKLDKYLNNI